MSDMDVGYDGTRDIPDEPIRRWPVEDNDEKGAEDDDDSRAAQEERAAGEAQA